MIIAARIAALATFLLLSGCGKALGSYDVREVTVVPGAVAKQVEPGLDPDPQMLRVEFTSKTDLYEASNGGDLYVFASFCPFQDKRLLSVSEPYFNDHRRFDPVSHSEGTPAKDPVTGDYAYTTYIRLSGGESANRGVGRLEFTSYDLRKRPVDLCLRIEHPMMFAITPSQSRVFILPAGAIRQAVLGQMPSSHSSPK